MSISRALIPLLIAGGLAAVLYNATDRPADVAKAASSRTDSPPLADTDGDGIPDFLLLDGPDAEAFRAWFAFLAEIAYYQQPEHPAEINDCAALLRFAFREALRKHDGSWASGLNLPVPPALPAVSKYNYPFTPVGAGLFRIREGSFMPDDATNGTFAQFADAETLRRYNARFISKDIRAARTGDLLFYYQSDQDMPYHAMVFLGPSSFERDARDWVVYHTGPIGQGDGEIRRPSVEDLLKHREPRWHPVAANTNFLGIYRWNILP